MFKFVLTCIFSCAIFVWIGMSLNNAHADRYNQQPYHYNDHRYDSNQLRDIQDRQHQQQFNNLYRDQREYWNAKQRGKDASDRAWALQPNPWD